MSCCFSFKSFFNYFQTHPKRAKGCCEVAMKIPQNISGRTSRMPDSTTKKTHQSEATALLKASQVDAAQGFVLLLRSRAATKADPTAEGLRKGKRSSWWSGEVSMSLESLAKEPIFACANRMLVEFLDYICTRKKPNDNVQIQKSLASPCGFWPGPPDEGTEGAHDMLPGNGLRLLAEEFHHLLPSAASQPGELGWSDFRAKPKGSSAPQQVKRINSSLHFFSLPICPIWWAVVLFTERKLLWPKGSDPKTWAKQKHTSTRCLRGVHTQEGRRALSCNL